MVEWFKHDFKARTHPRLQRIQMKYGMEGVGIYWSLIEMLYEEDGRLMLSECDAYAFALRMDSERLADFVKGCGAFIFEGDVFYSDTVHERMQERADKSEKASNNAKKRWNNANAMQTHSEGNAIREEKSREDKSREEKTHERPTIEQCIQASQMSGFTKEQGEAYYHFRNANGWMVARGKDGNLFPIANWRSDMVMAISKGYLEKQQDKSKPDPKEAYKGFKPL